MRAKPCDALVSVHGHIVNERVTMPYPPVSAWLDTHSLIGGYPKPHFYVGFSRYVLARPDAKQFLNFPADGIEFVILCALTPIDAGRFTVLFREKHRKGQPRVTLSVDAVNYVFPETSPIACCNDWEGNLGTQAILCCRTRCLVPSAYRRIWRNRA